MLTPNIDLKGRRARAVGGTLLLILSLLLAILLPYPWTWVVGVAVLSPALGGIFMLFEARRGWCAVRACGLKTPL
jgi:hypothetical protein